MTIVKCDCYPESVGLTYQEDRIEEDNGTYASFLAGGGKCKCTASLHESDLRKNQYLFTINNLFLNHKKYPQKKYVIKTGDMKCEFENGNMKLANSYIGKERDIEGLRRLSLGFSIDGNIDCFTVKDNIYNPIAPNIEKLKINNRFWVEDIERDIVDLPYP